MLAGLLLYDVFWVFGSPAVIGDNVMLTVATSDIVSGPTRLLFPRIAGGTGEASNFPFSLLGHPPPLPSLPQCSKHSAQDVPTTVIKTEQTCLMRNGATPSLLGKA